MSFGRGFIRDPHLGMYRSFKATHKAALKALPMGISDSSGLLPFIPPIQDQDGIGQCVARGIPSAMYALLSARGMTPAAPFSARAAYWLARAIRRARETSGELPPVTDSGCAPNDLIEAIATYGLASMYDIEGDGLVCDPTNANIELKAGEIIACDANRPKIEWTAVKDGDSTKLDQVIKALATRHPVTYAMEADKAFEEYDGKGVLTFAGQNPNHMQYAVDYRKNSAGDWEFLQINSWGQLWGMGGMAWVSAGSIQNATFNALIPELVQ